MTTERKKVKRCDEAVSIKTAKEYGTKHANQLKPFDAKYNDNAKDKQNYISRLEAIMRVNLQLKQEVEIKQTQLKTKKTLKNY